MEFYVHVGVEDFLLILGGFGDEAAVGVGDEGLAPEFGVAFAADAVDGRDITAVGDGVAALDSFPSVVLGGAKGFFLGGKPADGGGVENYVGAAEGGEAGGLGIPLVPADEDADAASLGFPGAVAEVAGSEVKLFFESGVLRDVILAVFAEELAVGVNDDGSVVVNFAATVFKEGSDDDDFVFLRGGAKGLSSVGPGMVSARSNFAGCWVTQK